MSDLSHQGAIRLIYKRNLDDPEREALRHHLRHCAACRQDAQMAGLLSRHLVLQQVATRPSPQLTANYMASAARRYRRSQIMKPIYAVGGAIALALIMLAGWYVTKPNVQSIEADQPTQPAIAAVPTRQSEAVQAEAEPSREETGVAADAALPELIAAVKAGDTEAVSALLAAGVAIDNADGAGHVLLPTAAKDGNLAIVQLLLDAGADVNTTMDGHGPGGGPYGQAPALVYAAAYGRFDVVELLLGNGADPNLAEFSVGYSALNEAARYDHADIIKILLASGADPNLRRIDRYASTPLYLAAANGSLEAAAALLQGGADVNAREQSLGRTPLASAIQTAPASTQNEMIRLLLDAGADPDLASDEGRTPLMYATQSRLGIKERLGLLFAAGADLDLQDADGNTSLHLAARYGMQEAVELLIAQGAALDIENNEGQTALDVALTDEIREMLREAGTSSGEHQLIAAVRAGDAAEVSALLAAGAEFDSVLPVAAQKGETDIAQLLLDAGADVDSTMDGQAPDGDPYFEAPALLHAASWGHLEVVELLLAYGADPNKAETSEGDVPLHHAAWFDHVEIVKALLDNGAEVDVRRTSDDHTTPLHWAVRNGSIENTQALIAAGADVNLREGLLGRTPLYMATTTLAGRSNDLIVILLDAGADVTLASDAGVTPLMVAVTTTPSGLTERIELLIEAGAALDAQDADGNTALHYAARQGTREAVELLIEHGADLDIKNNLGHSALDVAATDSIADTLRAAGAAES